MEVTPDVASRVANEQTKLWNGPAGCAWIEAQATLDAMFAPFENLLVGEVSASGARRVLDVGCGTGATTLAVARHLGPEGRVLGIDLSAPMIALARERGRREGSGAEFVVGDAAAHPFESRGFDALISRFGVMFFPDPLGAFTRLREAMRPRGVLRAIVFRGPAENPFMTAAERAAAPLMPELPPRRTAGPGQFAFADADRVRSILAGAGWEAIRIEPRDVPCTLPVSDLEMWAGRMGPVGLALRDADEATRERVTHAVRAAYQPYVHGRLVVFTAACWMLAAEA